MTSNSHQQAVDLAAANDASSKETSKSTQFRRSQAVADFLKDCDSYTAGAVSVLVRLGINSDTVAKGITEKDRYVLNLCLNDGFSSDTPDIATLQSYRSNRAMQLWDTASPYINRDTMASVCGILMQEASSYPAIQNHLNFLLQTAAK